MDARELERERNGRTIQFHPTDKMDNVILAATITHGRFPLPKLFRLVQWLPLTMKRCTKFVRLLKDRKHSITPTLS